MINFEQIWDYIIAILLAITGCFAALMNRKEGRLKLAGVLADVFISGFAGLMVLMFARATGLTGDWLGLLCGMAGWMGPKALDALATHVTKHIRANGGSTRHIKKDSVE